jgi:hypothetical protein
MKEAVGIIAIIVGFLNISLTIVGRGKPHELCAWAGWIVLGIIFFL